MQKLIAVHLHGPLADKYGTPHHFAIVSPREAIAALDANYPGFLGEFARHERYGLLVDGDVREGDEAALMPASQDIHFVPLIEGNVPFLAPVIASAFGIGTFAATIIGGVLMTGLMIGISLLFRPKKPDKKDDVRDDSFIFSGPENVTGQGVAVPLIYGRVFAGSVVVSAGQDVIPVGAPAGTASGAHVVTTTPNTGASIPHEGATTKPAGVPPPINKGGHG